MSEFFAQPLEPEVSSDTQINDAPIIPLNEKGRIALAEVHLARLSTSFIEDPAFNARTHPLPLDFIMGVKRYAATPHVDLARDWPPRSWVNKTKLTDLLGRTRLDGLDEALMDRDLILASITEDLVAATAAMPTSDPAILGRRTMLMQLHRLRTDELDHLGHSGEDEQWDAITSKIKATRPAGMQPDGV